jgi:hypothetical protein
VLKPCASTEALAAPRRREDEQTMAEYGVDLSIVNVVSALQSVASVLPG